MRALARDGQLACYRHDGLLAADGHAARPQPPRGAVELRRRRRGGRGPSTPMRRSTRGRTAARRAASWTPPSGGTAACCSPATPASRARGWRSGCSRSAPGVTGFSAARADRAVAVSSWRGSATAWRASTATCATREALAAALARGRARGRDPHGRAAARAPLLRRAARDVRDQRDGHRQRARRRAPARARACARS